MIPTFCDLSKYNTYQIINQHFGRVSIVSLKLMAIKVLRDGLPTNLPDLEDTWPIFLLTKSTKITICLTIDVSKWSHGFMLHMDFAFSDVERICVFTSTFVAIFSATSYPIIFPSIIRCPHIEILHFIFATLRNKYNKFSLIRVDEYGSL